MVNIFSKDFKNDYGEDICFVRILGMIMVMMIMVMIVCTKML